MIGRLLCCLGRHFWWVVSATNIATVLYPGGPFVPAVLVECRRCPAKKITAPPRFMR